MDELEFKKQLNSHANNEKASNCQFQVISEVFVCCFLLQFFQLQIQIFQHAIIPLRYKFRVSLDIKIISWQLVRLDTGSHVDSSI